MRMITVRSTPGLISTTEPMWFCGIQSSRRAISRSIQGSTGGASCEASRRSSQRSQTSTPPPPPRRCPRSTGPDRHIFHAAQNGLCASADQKGAASRAATAT